MKFEIDVSGYDIFKDTYVICLARDDGEIIKGFKFDKGLIGNLVTNWKANKYRYEYNIPIVTVNGNITANGANGEVQSGGGDGLIG